MWFKRSDGVLFEVEEGSESHRLISRDGGFAELPSSTEQSSEQSTSLSEQTDVPREINLESPDSETQRLQKMTVAQLRELAQERNITLAGNLNKTLIIAFLTGFGG